jgi:hypothetical protein
MSIAGGERVDFAASYIGENAKDAADFLPLCTILGRVPHSTEPAQHLAYLRRRRR